MNGKIEICKVMVGRAGQLTQKPCVRGSDGTTYTVKSIINLSVGGVSDDEIISELKVDLADILASRSYVEQYPQVMQ